MTVAHRAARYSIEDYLRLEEFANVKHEFCDGRIFAMAGGTPEHGALAVRVATALSNQLRGKRGNVYGSDTRVRVVATGLDTYPDVSVVCGSEQRDREDRLALVNPIVLVEVLSPATEAYDRGDKLEHYQRIPALQEIVLVAQDEPAIDVWRRRDDGWASARFGPGQVARLESIDCSLDVDEVFRDPFVAG
ncbi:MAG: Uma2 family endonuclease [Planctomycetota bacterium]